MPPTVSVVFATHDRAARLRSLLSSLEHQDTALEDFEVIVVDDGSSDDTPSVLEEAAANSPLALRTLRLSPAQGPAAARNAGWRAARGHLIAFTDDDCVATPGWLRAGVGAWDGDRTRVVQGRTDPMTAELAREGPFSRTLRVHELGPWFQTCNVFYPRELLERVGGFDEETFSVPGGEDCDLAHRCFAVGADAVFADDARVEHAVHDLGPVGKLRVAWRWSETMRLFARHPSMRIVLLHGIFWKRTHVDVLKLAAALALPRRAWPLKLWVLARLAAIYLHRARSEGQGRLWSAPWFVVHDVVETAAAVRGALRYRTWVV